MKFFISSRINILSKKASFISYRYNVTTTSIIGDFKQYYNSFPNISSKQWLKLNQLAFELYEWNSKVNLISRKDIQLLIPNHIIPSLSISLVKQFKENENIIDIGTGGGLPGIPLAIIYPNSKFTLLDSSTKKIKIVQNIVDTLKLNNVQVINSRAETYTEAKFEYMLGRSVKELPIFLSFSSHFLKGKGDCENNNIGGGLLYIKGGNFNNELKDCNINHHDIYPIRNLINVDPVCNSDKNILFVQTSEIKKFDLKNNKNQSYRK
jgi:16S rRNA (guanine527-N7)-methyltransferase